MINKGAVVLAAAAVGGFALVMILAVAGAGVIGGSGLLFAAGQGCTSNSGSGGGVQTVASTAAVNSIPSNYLRLFQQTGKQYGVSWAVLAGIGKVESNDGRTTLPGVHSGSNPFGAAGPMQIGIGGASGNTWGGAPIHPDSVKVIGVATDADGKGVANVYDPADAIAGAAKYLLEHGSQTNMPAAIFAYNHLASYVEDVLSWASTYSRGGFTVSPAAGITGTTVVSVQCPAVPSDTLFSNAQIPSQAAATAISYARAQLGKPYVFGATGPDAFDCSGLVMMAYRSAGITIPRTSEEQWAWGPRVPRSQVQPGDLVFFAGSDGTVTSPGHVGMVIGNGLMIEAPHTGTVVSIAPYGGAAPVGFTDPAAHKGAAPAT